LDNRRPIVLVTGPIHEDGLVLLRKEGVEVRVNDLGRQYSREELIQKLQDVDAVITLLDKFDREVIESSKKLKMISRHGVGYDTVDIDAATRAGVLVTVTPYALTESVAETAIGLMLSVARKLTIADRLVKEKRWTDRNVAVSKLMGVELAWKTLGIIGLGRIGAHVAKRAIAFGMKVTYYDMMRYELLEGLMSIEYVTLDELLSKSDFVSIHTPLTEATRGLIGERELKRMKGSAYLINTSRGQVVDQKALVRALKERWIAGAGLDVFDVEPIALSDPMLDLDNVVLTPHVSSATIEARGRMSREAALNVVTVLRGQQPRNTVNPPARS
jgi:D-3-phosphoglycerate dehydrogenase